MKPIVQDGVLWVEGEGGGGKTAVFPPPSPIPLNSPQWHHWLSTHTQFKFKGTAGHFSARRETRHGGEYWYAYRRRNGKLNKAYLGKLDELTLVRLEQAAANLAGKTVLSQLSLAVDSPGEALHEPWLNHTFPITAKTRPPVLPPNLIFRPRLTDKITTPITFISAPGGFGKSILLNIWQQECCNMPVAWATLDADDNHLLRFWSTVIMALRAILPGFGQELIPYLQMPSTISPAEIVTRLTNEFICTDGRPFCAGLVLDDFHHIQHPDIHTSLQSWLERLPSTLQLVISSRFRPPLALGRLRAMGFVTELDLDDLRFTLEEGVDLLQQHIRDSTLAYGDIETLVKRTGGWAVGLTLAGLSLNKQQDRRHVIDTFSGAHLFFREYFMETALRQQSTAVQTFLIKTSILKQLTGDLCNAITGQTDGGQVLSRLWQQNLFIIRSEEQMWYRYHDLFAEMLHNQLQLQFPDEIPDLHRRAVAWYQQHNASPEAVRHLLAIEDWEEAAFLIEDVGLRELIESGEDSRLLRWLQQLPETVVQHHKTLLFVYLRLAHLALHSREVERFLQRIESNLTSKPSANMTQDEKEVLAEIYDIRRRKIAGDQTITLTADPRWQLLDALWIVEPLYMAKTDEVGARMLEVYEQARTQGNLFVTLIAGGDCANRAFLRGHLRQSEKFAYQTLQDVLQWRGQLPEPASIILVTLSQICLARNELHQAEQLMQRAVAVDPNPTSSNMPVNITTVRAQLQSLQGDHEAARMTIKAARALLAQRPSVSWRDQDLAAYEARYCVRQGNWAEAERLLREIETGEGHALAQLTRAEMLLDQEQHAEAEAMLTQFVAQYPYGFPNEPTLGARTLLALALFEQHKTYQARQVLADAIRSAAPERLIRPFLDRGPQLLPLLVLSLHTQSLTTKCQEFVHEILQLLGHTEDVAELLPEANLKSLTSAAAITEREQDVLQLVGEGLSNREIALELCIAPGTVKTHLANIYGKLEVNNRVQAVAEAQALKLI
ncbi:MAG: LuxR C-terminal-related transcriptional regulator [Chloroflexota bacterium]